MIFGIKEKWIILTHTMYCCLLLQIYLCYLWLLCAAETHMFFIMTLMFCCVWQREPDSADESKLSPPDQGEDQVCVSAHQTIFTLPPLLPGLAFTHTQVWVHIHTHDLTLPFQAGMCYWCHSCTYDQSNTTQFPWNMFITTINRSVILVLFVYYYCIY